LEAKGTSMLEFSHPAIKAASLDAHDSGDNTIVAAIPGRHVRVVGIKLSVAGDVTITWKSGLGGTTTALATAETFKAGGGMSDFWGPHGYFFETLEGEALNCYLGGSVQVSGWINYVEIQ
jgi:hypothetical protein